MVSILFNLENYCDAREPPIIVLNSQFYSLSTDYYSDGFSQLYILRIDHHINCVWLSKGKDLLNHLTATGDTSYLMFI